MCVLYDKACIECGECEYCDLDKEKLCDNCGKCIDSMQDYRIVNIEKFIEEHKGTKSIKRYKKK